MWPYQDDVIYGDIITLDLSANRIAVLPSHLSLTDNFPELKELRLDGNPIQCQLVDLLRRYVSLVTHTECGKLFDHLFCALVLWCYLLLGSCLALLLVVRPY